MVVDYDLILALKILYGLVIAALLWEDLRN